MLVAVRPPRRLAALFLLLCSFTGLMAVRWSGVEGWKRAGERPSRRSGAMDGEPRGGFACAGSNVAVFRSLKGAHQGTRVALPRESGNAGRPLPGKQCLLPLTPRRQLRTRLALPHWHVGGIAATRRTARDAAAVGAQDGR